MENGCHLETVVTLLLLLLEYKVQCLWDRVIKFAAPCNGVLGPG